MPYNEAVCGSVVIGFILQFFTFDSCDGSFPSFYNIAYFDPVIPC